MNIREMQYAFGQQMNQFNEALALNSDDIQYWLNKGQLDLVKKKYNGITQDRRGFEQSQKRIDDLRVLLKRDEELETKYDDKVSGTEGFYVDRADFPNDYMFLIAHKSVVRYRFPNITFSTLGDKRVTSDSSSTIVFNRFSQSDDIYKLLDDPFNTTKIGSPIAVVNDNSIQVFTDDKFIVDKVIIDYLKIPRRMNIRDNVDSELPEHLHEDIIQRAVDLFLNNTRELKQRLQRETPASNQELKEQDNE